MVDKLKYFTITSIELTFPAKYSINIPVAMRSRCCTPCWSPSPSNTYNSTGSAGSAKSVVTLPFVASRDVKSGGQNSQCQGVGNQSWEVHEFLEPQMTFTFRRSTPKNQGFSFRINTRVNLGSRYLHYLHIMKPGAWKWLSAVIQIL